MNTYREQKIDNYIDENYPNAKVVNYLDDDSDLKYYSDEELASLDGDWFPLCCYRNEKGKLIYGGRDKIVHTYTEGETGAGKTTRFVMQSIRALSSTKGKPSFVIVDIHGEIIENLYSHLKNMGYDIKVLNCDDAARSDTYNPFGEIARECLESHSVTRRRRIISAASPKSFSRLRTQRSQSGIRAQCHIQTVASLINLRI